MENIPSHKVMSVSSKKGCKNAYIRISDEVFEMPVWAATDLAMLIFKNIGPVRFIKERIRLRFARKEVKMTRKEVEAK